MTGRLAQRPDAEPGYHFVSPTIATIVTQTLGVAQVVQVPVRRCIVVPAEFDEETCLITMLPTYITIPTDIAGNPTDPPIVPKLLGIDKLPGFQSILRQLIPAIGDIFGLLDDADGSA